MAGYNTGYFNDRSFNGNNQIKPSLDQPPLDSSQPFDVGQDQPVSPIPLISLLSCDFDSSNQKSYSESQVSLTQVMFISNVQSRL